MPTWPREITLNQIIPRASSPRNVVALVPTHPWARNPAPSNPTKSLASQCCHVHATSPSTGAKTCQGGRPGVGFCKPPPAPPSRTRQPESGRLAARSHSLAQTSPSTPTSIRIEEYDHPVKVSKVQRRLRLSVSPPSCHPPSSTSEMPSTANPSPRPMARHQIKTRSKR